MSTRKVNVAIMGSASAPSSFRSTSGIPTPTCTPSASAPRRSSTRSATPSSIAKRYTELRGRAEGPGRRFRPHQLADPRSRRRCRIAALKAGKHVMCTVPMATTVEDCQQIVELVKKTGLKYMMAETVVYAREFLFVKELYEKGELGKIQYLPASHQQDMDGWPNYWPGLPPMHYATHCVGPCLALTTAEAEYVSCFGSGTIREDTDRKYTRRSRSRRATSSSRTPTSRPASTARLFDTARQYRESFDVYGTKKTFEWPLVEDEEPVIHTAKKPEPEIPRARQGAGLRPPAARADPPFTTQGRPRRRRDAPVVHPGRRPRRLAPAPGARVPVGPRRGPRPVPERGAVAPTGPASASCAHESAMKGGEIVSCRRSRCLPDVGPLPGSRPTSRPT